MGFDEFVDKSKKVVEDSVEKVDAARKSERAENIRETTVRGFDKVMKMVLPGSDKKPPQIEGSGE